VGDVRPEIESLVFDSPEDARDSLLAFPQAGIAAEQDELGIRAWKWDGDLLEETLGVLEAKAIEEMKAQRTEGPRPVVLLLERRGRGVRTYSEGMANRVQDVLDFALPGRTFVFDDVRTKELNVWGRDWASYFEDQFPCRIEPMPTRDGNGIRISGTLCRRSIQEHFAPEQQEGLEFFSFAEEARITKEAVRFFENLAAKHRWDKGRPLPVKCRGEVRAALTPLYVKNLVSLMEAPCSGPDVQPRQGYDVFLSHKSEDRELCRSVYDLLSKAGMSAFMSEMSIAEMAESDFRKAIDDAIEQCRHMVVVASSAKNAASLWVEYEWGTFLKEKLAGRKKGNLITVMDKEEVEKLPLSLRAHEVIEKTEEGMKRLLRFLK
jgi:hypothetical protein